MNDLQKRLLEMLAWFHEYCEKEQLCYYIVGGTFLGAVRHKGFIPWDDDIDVAMPREDYERLIHLFEQYYNQTISHYKLETVNSNAPDFLYTYGKLYDTTTTMVEKARIDCKRGVYLDVFPLDGVGDTIEEAYAWYKKIDRWNMLLMTRMCAIRKQRSFLKNMAIVVSRFVPNFIINNKKLARRVNNMCKTKTYESSKFVCDCASAYRYRVIMDKHIMGVPTKYVFEDIVVYGPEKADEYLTQIYGEWQKLPPIEKQVTHHDFICLDLNKSYLDD